MTPESVLTLAQQALQLALMLAAPLLLVSLAVGLLIGIFQAATQINEMTLSFIPKLLALAATLTLAGPWMLVMTAPLLNAQAVPPRVRLIFSIVLTAVIAPLLPRLPPMALFGSDWWLTILHESIVGIALGLALQLVFEAAMLAGELVSYGMGLGFAQLVDPLHGAAAPMLGQFYQVCAMLLFLSLGGLLQVVQLLADSFRLAPVGGTVLEASSFLALAQFGGLCFSGALRIALPAVMALLLVNLGFGAMNRSAPALNAMSLGFPLALIAGLLALCFSLPQLQVALTDLVSETLGFIAQWLKAL
jgi:flagellar biosynthetic protein FliR